MNDIKAISLYDMSGRLIKKIAPTTELDLSSLSKESYLLVIIMEDNQTKIFKVIKK